MPCYFQYAEETDNITQTLLLLKLIQYQVDTPFNTVVVTLKYYIVFPAKSKLHFNSSIKINKILLDILR